LPGRGPTPGLRFVGYAFLSITLMFLDRREGWMEQVRYGLQIATYPLQLAVSSPSTAWGWVRESSRTRDTLRAENNELRTRLRDLELRTMRYEALGQENAQLRGLSTALPPVAEKWLVAELVNVELDHTRPRVLINRGGNNGVFRAQAVLSDEGIVGQTTHVGPWSAEVILITDPEHAIPVQVERTGMRTIAQGTDDGELELPYLTSNSDVKVGDLLITSGMGGVFPQGYPVGKITAVHWEAVLPQSQVRAAPLAHINRDREVMLVWFRDTHPAAPVPTAPGDLPKGDPNAKPQATPPKPKPVAPAVEAAAGTAVPATGAAGAAGTSRPGTATLPPVGAPGRPTAGPRQTVPTPVPKPAASGATGAATPAGATSPKPATPASQSSPKPPGNRE
jgi:rod shape-determining protein MreC